MNYFIEILFVSYNVITAYLQAQRFKEGKTINHTLWGGIYALLVVMAGILDSVLMGIVGVVVRVVVFSPALNLFRKKPYFYLNFSGESFIDRLYHDEEHYKMIYFIMCFLMAALNLIL